MPKLDGPLYRRRWPSTMQPALYWNRKKRRSSGTLSPEETFEEITGLVPLVMFLGQSTSTDGNVTLTEIGGVQVGTPIESGDGWNATSPLIVNSWEFDRGSGSGLLYPDTTTMDVDTATYWALFMGFRQVDMLNSFDAIVGKREDLNPLFPGWETCVDIDPADLFERTEETGTGTRLDTLLTNNYDDTDPHTLGWLFDPLDSGTFSFASESELGVNILNDLSNDAPLHFGQNRKTSAAMRISWVAIVTGPQLSGYTGIDLLNSCIGLQSETT